MCDSLSLFHPTLVYPSFTFIIGAVTLQDIGLSTVNLHVSLYLPIPITPFPFFSKLAVNVTSTVINTFSCNPVFLSVTTIYVLPGAIACILPSAVTLAILSFSLLNVSSPTLFPPISKVISFLFETSKTIPLSVTVSSSPSIPISSEVTFICFSTKLFPFLALSVIEFFFNWRLKLPPSTPFTFIKYLYPFSILCGAPMLITLPFLVLVVTLSFVNSFSVISAISVQVNSISFSCSSPTYSKFPKEQLGIVSSIVVTTTSWYFTFPLASFTHI